MDRNIDTAVLDHPKRSMSRAQKNFEKRFGNPMRITVTYVQVPESEREEWLEGLFDAYVLGLKDILGREPTKAEIYGEESIEDRLRPDLMDKRKKELASAGH